METAKERKQELYNRFMEVFLKIKERYIAENVEYCWDTEAIHLPTERSLLEENFLAFVPDTAFLDDSKYRDMKLSTEELLKRAEKAFSGLPDGLFKDSNCNDRTTEAQEFYCSDDLEKLEEDSSFLISFFHFFLPEHVIGFYYELLQLVSMKQYQRAIEQMKDENI